MTVIDLVKNSKITVCSNMYDLILDRGHLQRRGLKWSKPATRGLLKSPIMQRDFRQIHRSADTSDVMPHPIPTNLILVTVNDSGNLLLMQIYTTLTFISTNTSKDFVFRAQCILFIRGSWWLMNITNQHFINFKIYTGMAIWGNTILHQKRNFAK